MYELMDARVFVFNDPESEQEFWGDLFEIPYGERDWTNYVLFGEGD